MRSILLVDDNKETLDDLTQALRGVVPANEAEIRAWMPSGAEDDAESAFYSRVDDETTLVVADYDLTSQGRTGLFGSSIVAWCQALAIPVGDYSRAADASLPKEPDLFELRIPPDAEQAAPFIAAIFRGFRWIAQSLEASNDFLGLRSPGEVLARILGAQEEGNQLSLYAVRLGAASGALMAALSRTAAPGEQAAPATKRAILSYIGGHLLLSVLRFPGPILSTNALKAYVASDEADAADVAALFVTASYEGPFAELGPFYWRSKVDLVLDHLVPPDAQAETTGELYRMALERRLGRALSRHGCPRCHGVNGGFFCPFTKRTVCQLPYCSVSSNSWIPQGANMCRIEREFFDEWAPVLGL